jgi:hypothetical protein
MKTREKIMRDNAALERLLAAVQRYFDLMYDCDVSNFARVFWTTAQLHGFRDGAMTAWPHDTYKDVLSKRQSPKAQNAPREEKVLLLDFASASQALVKVRVRIGATHFIDYLTYHLIGGEWLITSKAYHVDS